MPEESFTQASFRNTFKKQYEFVNVTVLGADSSGTHFYWDDARGERHFGVISDLLGKSHVHTATLSHSVASKNIPNGAFTTVNTVSFTPLRQPYHLWAFWDWIFATAGAGGDLIAYRVRRTAPTGAPAQTRLNEDDFSSLLSGSSQEARFSYHLNPARLTSTVGATVITEFQFTPGVPPGSIDIADSRLSLLVLYEG